MRFTSILKNVILENSRFEILFDALTKPSKDKKGLKQKPKLTQEEFFALVSADPTTRMNEVDVQNMSKEDFGKIKAGKYVNWIIKNFLDLSGKLESDPDSPNFQRELKQRRDLFLEDLYKVTDDLKKFERFKNRLPQEKRDINKMNTDELYDAVKDFDLTLATTTKSERKTAEVHPGAKMVYDGENWRVIEIKDKGESGKEAACFYGGNQQETRWCTSAPGLNWFDRYIKDGPLYVLYNPKDTNVSSKTGLPVERYQFHFPSNQFMDKDDRQIDLIDFLVNKAPELKDLFKSYFIKGITNDGTKLDIDSLSSGSTGKFVAIYGLDELINNLPDELEEFKIRNKDKTDLIIKIPESIGRFKNLNMILLQNCIDNIPNSICELPKLRFLSLMDNKNLTSIPDCVVDLPRLLFINLRGSDSVVVPNILKERATDMGKGYWDMGVD